MIQWLVYVRFKFPEGSTRERSVVIDAETKHQAEQLAMHMAREMTRHPNVSDPAGADYFDQIVSVRPLKKG